MFERKTKRTIKRKEKKNPKSVEYEFTKLRRATARHIREEAEIILKLFYLARSWVFDKRTFELTEFSKISQAWFSMCFLAEHARKYIQGHNLKTGWLAKKASTKFKLKMIFWKK